MLKVFKSVGCHLSLMVIILVRLLREELQLLQEQGSHVGEVIKAMDKKKVLVKVSECVCLQNKYILTLKVHPEGKYVVDLDKGIDMNDVRLRDEYIM